MENNQITNILTMSLIAMLTLLFILIIIYIILKIKSNKKEKNENKNLTSKQSKAKTQEISKEQSRKSVLDFMNFYTIQDDMIIQKKGKKFLMVLQCQGINYDLMSETEKNSVEEGFVQFLNTLTHPIQLYIQTRKVNLTSSIETYKRNLKQTEDKLNKAKYQYEKMKKSELADSKQLNKLLFEVTKQNNLYEYTKDIIRNTEMMSLNKNILSKQYYIVISYTPEGDESALLGENEIAELAFSELYTRAQSLSRVLAVCEVNCKVLDSLELSELLYVAYNRDESDIFGVEKAVAAGYDNLYVTAPDVLDKKKKIIDKKIEEEGFRKANDAVEKAKNKSKKEKEIEEKEKNMDQLIKDMAKLIIEQNREYLTQDIADSAIKEIENSEDKEEKK